MADEEEIVYVVAPGTIVYTDDGNVFFAGEKITPENVGNLSAFRALVAAGKIVTSAGEDAPPQDDSKWNYTEIDDRLSATSPNPVENRALYKEFETMGKQIAALTEAMAEPITQEDLREMWTENNQEVLNDGEKYLDESGLASVINRIKADFATKANTLSGYDIGDAYTKSETDSRISAAVSSVYKPMGSFAFSALPEAASQNVGDVFNVIDAFTTTDQFVEGAGLKFPAGTNIVVVDDGSAKKYDVLTGMVDLTPYAKTEDFEPISAEEINALWGESETESPEKNADETT